MNGNGEGLPGKKFKHYYMINEEIRIILMIVDKQGSKGATTEIISKAINKSASTTRKAIALLEEEKLIKVNRSKRPYIITKYKIESKRKHNKLNVSDSISTSK